MGEPAKYTGSGVQGIGDFGSFSELTRQELGECRHA
jgi:hypothetical protein